MKYLLIMMMGINLGCFSKTFKRPEGMQNVVNSDFYSLKARDMNGKEVAMEAYRGKKILIVNVASECGYTPQYAELQELYSERKDELVVLGFPCNDFGGQEPGSNEEIVKFCQTNFEVDFPLFDKISIKGAERPELYRWLTDEKENGWNSEAPNWNFCKYLVNEKGELTHFFRSKAKPKGEEITKALDQ